VSPVRSKHVPGRKPSGRVLVSVIDLQKKIAVDPAKIKKLAGAIFYAEARKKKGRVSICFVSDVFIKRLNRLYHFRNCPTDVLSFDISEDKDRFLSDIFISTDTAVSNSKVFKTTPLYEMFLYVVHGILHITGYDDIDPKDRQLMRKKELMYLGKPPIMRRAACK
jgi:probable rRNA maturation factor